ncbi:MAG: RrF2 family transcriptional regulator [Fimbriimonas sp.]
MLSSRAKYATRAVLHLSTRDNDQPVAIQEIAEAQNVPLKYLQQILAALKVAGFVQSRKGPGGGYALARPAREITLGDVLRAMDGPLAPIACLSDSKNAECGCPNPDACALRESFRDVSTAMAKILDATTFADLAERQKTAENSLLGVQDFVI